MRSRYLLFFVFFTFQSLAQDLLNIPVAGNNSQVRAVNLKENGLIVLDRSSVGILNIVKVDTDLNVSWETQTDISAGDDYIDHFYDGNFVYLILAARNNKNLSIVKISTSFPGYQKFEVPVGSNFEYGFFAANEKAVVLGGALKNEPFLVIMETFEPSPKFISSGIKGDLEIESLHIEDEIINVTYINTFKKKNRLILRAYDISGKVISNVNIPAGDNTVFLSGRYFKSGAKSFIVGNFGLGNLRESDLYSSQGVYILDVSTQDIQYYGFDQFENVFKFLNERQQDRLKKRVRRKKSQGTHYNFNYRLLITDLKTIGGQTLITAEIFQPEFRSRNYPGYYGLSSYSNMYWSRPNLYQHYLLNNPFYGYNYRSSQVFDGFRYYEGVVFSISEEGELIWDAGFPYNYLKYYDLENHLYLSRDKESTKVIYNTGSLLQVSEIDVFGKLTSETELNPRDLIGNGKRTEFANFDHWYGNVYLNWGVQKIGNSNYCFIQKITP